MCLITGLVRLCADEDTHHVRCNPRLTANNYVCMKSGNFYGAKMFAQKPLLLRFRYVHNVSPRRYLVIDPLQYAGLKPCSCTQVHKYSTESQSAYTCTRQLPLYTIDATSSRTQSLEMSTEQWLKEKTNHLHAASPDRLFLHQSDSLHANAIILCTCVLLCLGAHAQARYTVQYVCVCVCVRA